MPKDLAQDIGAKLWNLCNILKDDGVTYHQYVTELTYLLFLKMAEETGIESRLKLRVPKQKKKASDPYEWEEKPGVLWEDLIAKDGIDQLRLYEDALTQYGRYGSGLVLQIYANSATSIKKATTLSQLIKDINKLDWYSTTREDLGDLYEDLLQRNANEKKSGAGQYFTPRPLIDSIVAVMKPTRDDVIQDPAAGTGGFLIAAHHYVTTHDSPSAWTTAQQKKYYSKTFYGMEHVHDTHRLALMNLMLHGIESGAEDSGIIYGDTLSSDGKDRLPPPTLILTNPPFGSKKGGGLPTRDDFTYPTSNKQLCFLQHIYRALRPGGRAAVVLPDNVLFEGNTGRQIRVDLMEKCKLHTILRLPTGIFYAQGVKTNVLFFTRGEKDKGNTSEVWFYDMRANMPQFGKRTVLTRDHFVDFEKAFGNDPLGGDSALRKRKDTGEEGRFRRFSRAEIATRGDNLDISWLKDEDDSGGAKLPEPAFLANEALRELEGAMDELRGILLELGEEIEEVEA